MNHQLIARVLIIATGLYLAGCTTTPPPGSALQQASPLQNPPVSPAAPAGKPVSAFEQAGIIDDFASTQQTWKVEGWANPATLSMDKGALKIELQPGKTDKVTVSRQVNTYLSKPHHIALDVDNQTEADISVAIAVATGKAPTYFESPPVKVTPGLTRNVAFDLASDRFKAASTQWMHSAKISEINALRLVYVVIYNSGKGTVYLDNLRAVTK